MGPLKRDQTGFIRVQREPILRHALVQYRQHSLRVFLPLEADDEVIRVTDEPCPSLETGFDVALEPKVEGVVVG